MNSEERYISVIDPLTPAVERVKTILFRPFDLGRWFVIGFCAWLAYLGHAGGGGGGPGGGGPSRGHGGAPEFRQVFYEAKEFVLMNLTWIIPLAVFILLFAIALWLLVTWLSSRGRFMFLHCVAGNKAEVKIPWRQFARHGNSLFAFRIVLALIAFAATLLPVVFIVLLVAGMVSAGAPAAGPILGAIFLGLTVIAIAIVIAVIKLFTADFVVPIMFLGATSCTAAWREFLSLLSTNKGRFALYVLAKIVIALVVGFIIMIAICATCCCAGCIMAIPYIGTVLMLPILIFKRSYSLYYIRQYDPRFDVFADQPQASLPAAGPESTS